MALATETTLVVFFSDRVRADRAVEKLGEAGFRPGQIRVDATQQSLDDPSEPTAGTHADTGAFVGAVAGAGLGLLAGIGLVSGLIPAPSLFLVTGAFAMLVVSASVCAAVAGLIGALIGWGLRKEPWNHYEDHLERGGLAVSVQPAGQHKLALEILNLYGGTKQ